MPKGLQLFETIKARYAGGDFNAFYEGLAVGLSLAAKHHEVAKTILGNIIHDMEEVGLDPWSGAEAFLTVYKESLDV